MIKFAEIVGHACMAGYTAQYNILCAYTGAARYRGARECV